MSRKEKQVGHEKGILIKANDENMWGDEYLVQTRDCWQVLGLIFFGLG